MVLKPRLYDGCVAAKSVVVSAEILYADVELQLYEGLTAHIEEHELSGTCRRTVWNRHLSDHHILAITIPLSPA